MAEFEGDAAKDQPDQQQQHRYVKGRQKHRIDQREGGEQRGADHHQPGLVAVPKRRDRRHHLLPQRRVAGGAEEDADAEVEAVEDHVDEDRDHDHACPEQRQARRFDGAHFNEKIRLFPRIGDALLGAKETGEDALEAVAKVISWDKFAETIKEAKGLVRTDGPDYLALAERNHAVLRRIGPLFLNAFTFEGVAAVADLLRAVELLRPFYAGNRRGLPKDLPTTFIRRSWQSAVLKDGKIDGEAYELCFFAELRDRLRAGDVWVTGSRQYRAVEDQLLAKPLFIAMKEAGPPPV